MKHTSAEREKYWTQVIEEARKYPTGVAAYCADKNVSKHKYYLWFKQLRVNYPEWGAVPNKKAPGKKPYRSVLIPVKVVSKQAEPPNQEREHIELRLRSGHVLVLPACYNGDQLLQMIRGLEK